MKVSQNKGNMKQSPRRRCSATKKLARPKSSEPNTSLVSAMVYIERRQHKSIVSAGAAKESEDTKASLLNQKDILFGRGGESNKNEGNQRYLKIIDERCLIYGGITGRKAKTLFAWDIYKQLKREGFSFLKHDSRGGKGWEEAAPKACRKKISQRLRERALIAREANEHAAQNAKLVLPAKKVDPTSTILPSSILSGIDINEKHEDTKEEDAEESLSVATVVPEAASLYSSDDSIETLEEFMERNPFELEGAILPSFGLEPEPITDYEQYQMGVNMHSLGLDPLYHGFGSTPRFAV